MAHPADPLDRAFAALADPTRRDLVARLTRGDATVGELAAPYAVSLQAVSKHLGVLEDAGLVRRGRAGRSRPVTLEIGVLDQMTSWLETYRRLAEERYRRLDAVLAELDEPPAVPSPGAATHEQRRTTRATPPEKGSTP